MSRDDRYNNDRYDDRDDALKIRTKGSRVVRVREWDDGRWKREDIDRNERYFLQDDLLVHEKRNRVRYYEDADGDGIWRRTSQNGATGSDPLISGGTPVVNNGSSNSWDGDDPHRFDLVDSQVSNLKKFDDGRWKRERIDYNETWTFDGTNLVKTEQEHYGNEISTFTDPDGDGIFTKVSEIYAAF